MRRATRRGSVAIRTSLTVLQPRPERLHRRIRLGALLIVQTKTIVFILTYLPDLKSNPLASSKLRYRLADEQAYGGKEVMDADGVADC